jgi:hypothetical protein
MTRDRAWRRNIEQQKVKYRLKMVINKRVWSYRYFDINNLFKTDPKLSDYICGYEYKMFKTYKTSRNDTKYKCKYSPNKGRAYYRDTNNKETREKYKSDFYKLLKEYGLR